MASTSNQSTCDVFVSFRGEDVRLTFASHLQSAFAKTTKTVFRDDKDIAIGDQIYPELQKAIAAARVYIVVFSKNYADSKWCLKELVAIVKCRDEGKQGKKVIMPVFYDVEPWEVRKQKGSYQKAFDNYQNIPAHLEEVGNWRSAMTRVADISGRDLKNRSEADVIKDIVSAINRKLMETSITEGLVGIDLQVKYLENEYMNRTQDVHIIEIYGEEGIGKTTIATVAYDKLYPEFERRCFLANVKEVYEKLGPVPLQNQLLSELLKEGDINVSDADEGKQMIIDKLGQKKVLIVLDNVDSLEQLKNLVVEREFFDSETLIIMTTEHQNLLQPFGVDTTYPVKGLNDHDSRELFCQKAFRKKQPPEGYEKVLREVVSCAKSNPLAIEVLGSYWADKKQHVWEKAKEKLKSISSTEGILPILEECFKGLKETEKELFLDIACFFKGSDIDHVTHILASRDSKATATVIDAIDALIVRSFIKVSENKLWIHDMLQKIGQDNDRHRLWDYKDVQSALKQENQDKSAVQSIVLELPKKEKIKWNGKGFEGMSDLRLLKLKNVQLSEGPKFLPNSLRFLEWDGYPSQSLPASFKPPGLSQLNMCDSRIEILWKREKREIELNHLISINLSGSENLTETPDITKIPNLERLILEGCKSLRKVRPDNICHKNLLYLNMKDCENLRNLASSMEMQSLRELILSGCLNLREFPRIRGEMNNLSKLHLDGTEIEKPGSIDISKESLSFKPGKTVLPNIDS